MGVLPGQDLRERTPNHCSFALDCTLHGPAGTGADLIAWKFPSRESIRFSKSGQFASLFPLRTVAASSQSDRFIPDDIIVRKHTSGGTTGNG